MEGSSRESDPILEEMSVLISTAAFPGWYGWLTLRDGTVTLPKQSRGHTELWNVP